MEGYFKVETWYQSDEKSVALIVLNGVNEVVKNMHSCTSYEIVSGYGLFKVRYGNGIVASQPVQPGSVVTIPVGVRYQDIGDLYMLATSCPSFDPNTVEKFAEI